MSLIGLDHIVLSVRDVEASLQFYERMLGMARREERPGKWSLHFGSNKISLQQFNSVPEIAKNTLPGTGNFCVLTDQPVGQFADALQGSGITILDGPVQRDGATGLIESIYFHDPDGNLVEVSNLIARRLRQNETE